MAEGTLWCPSHWPTSLPLVKSRKRMTPSKQAAASVFLSAENARAATSGRIVLGGASLHSKRRSSLWPARSHRSTLLPPATASRLLSVEKARAYGWPGYLKLSVVFFSSTV